jgi:hypothetical protein
MGGWCVRLITSYFNIIRKVTSGELLTKQWERNCHIQNIRAYLSVVTTGTEALVVSGNKFLHARVKEVCCLWDQPNFDTIHQLLINVEELWSQTVIQASKQVGHSERGQDCKEGGHKTPSWNAPTVLECEELCADVHCHGEALYRMSAFHCLFPSMIVSIFFFSFAFPIYS